MKRALALALLALAYLAYTFRVGGEISLLGAGSSFQYPLMSRWISEYRKVNPKVSVSYQSVGSGAGIRLLTAGSVDWGSSDVPMSREERAKAPDVLHIPVTLGGVAVVYNLPELGGRLKLTGELLAAIYLGKVRKWSSPEIRAVNPGLNLPDEEIVVVKRADGSGTTYILTDYLSEVSEEWRLRVGRGKTFSFPPEVGARGIAAKGNEGVAAVVRQSKCSIGYVELAYAIQSSLQTALIRNRDGFFVEPNLTTISAAAAGAAGLLPRGDESWEHVSIVNAPGRLSYPISSFSYVIVCRVQESPEKARALAEFLTWVVTEGQRYAPQLHYPPLPREVVELNLQTIAMITSEGSGGRQQLRCNLLSYTRH
ncbi:MAG: phosphate ABC transporter substrate-binding protein PstS [Thermoproteota archaeon]|nr:MAG: phosphate ABC transporter substrate-binding protein PstS [Candidatus Korarchaeota archaeon]